MASNLNAELRRFEVALIKIDKKFIPELVQTITRKVGLQVLTGVVLRTPVKTGRARGNWQVGLGNPPSSAKDTTDQSGSDTISKGQSTVLKAKAFEVIWVANNLPYIIRLEEGSSSQAPQGMVAVTLAEVTSQFKGL